MLAGETGLHEVLVGELAGRFLAEHQVSVGTFFSLTVTGMADSCLGATQRPCVRFGGYVLK